MRISPYVCICLVAFMPLSTSAAKKQKHPKKAKTELWPDGTKMDTWFLQAQKVNVDSLGKQYVITDYGVKTDSTLLQTTAIQGVIDLAAQQGGGVIVVPKGTYLSGALFFRPKTHLLLSEGGKLKASDRIAHFPILLTRMEGETCKYFSAFINADRCDGFTIAGKGIIDGNGRHYWEEFWIRRQWNSQCTNKDAQRPRLVYISNSSHVTLQDVHLQNSPFWTNHIYRCDHVRFLDCSIYAPTQRVKAPSSDAIDIDVCHDILVNGCYMHVNDDAIAINGGKGTWADQLADNGPVYNVLIQNCVYGKVHGCLTLGSESVNDRNIILRNITVKNAKRVLWLKLRPDTPQHYEYVTVDNITGTTGSFLTIRPWTQFFKPGERADMPQSLCNNITMRNIRMDCDNFFDVGTSDKYRLTHFTFENITCNDKKMAFRTDVIENTICKNVNISKKE